LISVFEDSKLKFREVSQEVTQLAFIVIFIAIMFFQGVFPFLIGSLMMSPAFAGRWGLPNKKSSIINELQWVISPVTSIVGNVII